MILWALVCGCFLFAALGKSKLLLLDERGYNTIVTRIVEFHQIRHHNSPSARSYSDDKGESVIVKKRQICVYYSAGAPYACGARKRTSLKYYSL